MPRRFTDVLHELTHPKVGRPDPKTEAFVDQVVVPSLERIGRVQEPRHQENEEVAS